MPHIAFLGPPWPKQRQQGTSWLKQRENWPSAPLSTSLCATNPPPRSPAAGARTGACTGSRCGSACSPRHHFIFGDEVCSHPGTHPPRPNAANPHWPLKLSQKNWAHVLSRSRTPPGRMRLVRIGGTTDMEPAEPASNCHANSDQINTKQNQNSARKKIHNRLRRRRHERSVSAIDRP